jgi:phosphoglycolate phosphatase-like HAD superfamily hydrolase
MRLPLGARTESEPMNPPNPDARLWLFDFDNTLAALEREVDWPCSRRELEAFLRDAGIDDKIFAEIPKGNLPLYAALHARWLRNPSPQVNVPTAGANTLPIRVRAFEPHYTSATERTTPSLESIDPTEQPPREIAEALLRGASEIIERHELIGVERARPTEGAIELLKALDARGSVVVIVTSNSSRTVARWLQIHGTSRSVQAIVGRDSMLALKPSPEMVLRAREFGSTPISDAVFVGDSDADSGAARAAGLGFYGIAITDAARSRLSAAGAREVFASPTALRVHLNLKPTASTVGVD